MIIDSNAYIGHWPFRPLRNNTTQGLIELMDNKGIDKAVVSSIHSIFYKNSHAGNEELAADVRRYEERLIPLAVLNPRYPGWEDDLKTCVEVFGMKGLRLFPYYHDYRLNDPEALQLIEAAAGFSLPVFLPMRVVDMRQRHWFDTTENLLFADIVKVVKRFEDSVTFVIQEGIYPTENHFFDEDTPKRVFYEISRLTSVYGKNLPQLLEKVGTERILFGTGIPFKYPEPTFLKIALLHLNEEEKAKIFYKNIAEILNCSN
jgi:predicted TIM-barrel fold metal-dependent hydrolase